MDRRTFITLTAITGTSAALASCGHPEHQLVRFVPDEDIVPGQAVWKPSICPLCAAGCGMRVRVMDADADVVRNGQSGVVRIAAAKKLEGSQDYPINRGRLCARGQAAIQVTYHPDRITQPLRRVGPRGEGRYEPVSWEDAIAQIVQRLDSLEDPRRLTWLTRRRRSCRDRLLGQFLARLGAPPAIAFELFSDDVLRCANGWSFGRAQLPTFDLANADVVLNFGADFLGTWNSPVAQAAAYGDMRQGRPGVRGRVVQVEGRLSQTGANADEWVPIRPGRDAALALGIAHVIMAERWRSPDDAGAGGRLIEGWRSGLASYTPDRVAQMTGVAAARITRLAQTFADGRAAVAIIGGPALAHTNGVFNALAVNALNALVGAVGRDGGILFTPPLPGFFSVPNAFAAEPTALGQLVEARPDVVMVDGGANPVFTAPRAWRVREALERVPFIASFGSFLDETTALADVILPDHSFLESWIDAVPESGSRSGVVGIAAPVMRPLHSTRAMPDVLLEIDRRLRGRARAALPWQTYEELLAASAAALPARSADADPWAAIQQQGGWWNDLPQLPLGSPSAAAGHRIPTEPTFDGDVEQFPFHFLPYPSTRFADGSTAHLPWLQEMPDPMTSAMWSSWVEINPETAQQLGIGPGDLVEVASSAGVLQVAAVLTPGVAPDVIAMPFGQGHDCFTRYATGRGANAGALLAAATEPVTGAVAWAATRVRVTRIGAPDGRLILFAGGDREHPYKGLGRG